MAEGDNGKKKEDPPPPIKHPGDEDNGKKRPLSDK